MVNNCNNLLMIILLRECYYLYFEKKVEKEKEKKKKKERIRVVLLQWFLYLVTGSFHLKMSTFA